MEAEDPQRGLTDEGRRAVERMAEYVALLGLRVDRIEHSDKLRARQTAELLAARLRPAEGTKQVAGIAPNDDVEPMRARLEREVTPLMLVGHLPYLSRLVARLLGLAAEHGVVQFQNGGVVHLERGPAGPGSAGAERWVLRWALVPDLLPPR